MPQWVYLIYIFLKNEGNFYLNLKTCVVDANKHEHTHESWIINKNAQSH